MKFLSYVFAVFLLLPIHSSMHAGLVSEWWNFFKGVTKVFVWGQPEAVPEKGWVSKLAAWIGIRRAPQSSPTTPAANGAAENPTASTPLSTQQPAVSSPSSNSSSSTGPSAMPVSSGNNTTSLTSLNHYPLLKEEQQAILNQLNKLEEQLKQYDNLTVLQKQEQILEQKWVTNAKNMVPHLEVNDLKKIEKKISTIQKWTNSLGKQNDTDKETKLTDNSANPLSVSEDSDSESDDDEPDALTLAVMKSALEQSQPIVDGVEAWLEGQNHNNSSTTPPTTTTINNPAVSDTNSTSSFTYSPLITTPAVYVNGTSVESNQEKNKSSVIAQLTTLEEELQKIDTGALDGSKKISVRRNLKWVTETKQSITQSEKTFNLDQDQQKRIKRIQGLIRDSNSSSAPQIDTNNKISLTNVSSSSNLAFTDANTSLNNSPTEVNAPVPTSHYLSLPPSNSNYVNLSSTQGPNAQAKKKKIRLSKKRRQKNQEKRTSNSIQPNPSLPSLLDIKNTATSYKNILNPLIEANPSFSDTNQSKIKTHLETLENILKATDSTQITSFINDLKEIYEFIQVNKANHKNQLLSRKSSRKENLTLSNFDDSSLPFLNDSYDIENMQKVINYLIKKAAPLFTFQDQLLLTSLKEQLVDLEKKTKEESVEDWSSIRNELGSLHSNIRRMRKEVKNKNKENGYKKAQQVRGKLVSSTPTDNILNNVQLPPTSSSKKINSKKTKPSKTVTKAFDLMLIKMSKDKVMPRQDKAALYSSAIGHRYTISDIMDSNHLQRALYLSNHETHKLLLIQALLLWGTPIKSDTIHTAALSNCSSPIIRMLYNMGVDFNGTDTQGKTAIERLLNQTHTFDAVGMILCLISYGAKITPQMLDKASNKAVATGIRNRLDKRWKEWAEQNQPQLPLESKIQIKKDNIDNFALSNSDNTTNDVSASGMLILGTHTKDEQLLKQGMAIDATGILRPKNGLPPALFTAVAQSYTNSTSLSTIFNWFDNKESALQKARQQVPWNGGMFNAIQYGESEYYYALYKKHRQSLIKNTKN